MTEAKEDYKQQIADLLSHYTDGQDIFKNAADWDHALTRNPGSEDADLPETWLELADKVISIVAHKKYGLDTYPNKIDIIDAEQMLDAYTTAGMPVGYAHWSFGKQRETLGKQYKGGQMGLAYEIVINTNPAIAYCMGQNSKTMQMLVIAHASYGHNSFFKGNHLFRQFTKPEDILNDLKLMKEHIAECEKKYGVKEVEKLLDACHALQSHGVDRYKRPPKRTPEEEAARRARLAEMQQQNIDIILDTTASRKKLSDDFRRASEKDDLQSEGEENLLHYIATTAPHLQSWQRKIITDVSNVAQYFYPQRQTQVMNEGWASFWHYTIMTDLHDMELISDGMFMEFIHSHTSVLFQPEYDSKYFSGSMNPYALGFAIYDDIKRMCQNPTEEDKAWFPDLAGNPDWLATLKDAMENYKDESFILQFLSPKVMRDFHLFAIQDDDRQSKILVKAIHNEKGYTDVRNGLAAQYRLGDLQPRIEIVKYNAKGDRSLTLRHVAHNRKPLDSNDIQEVIKHIHKLWGHDIILTEPRGEHGQMVQTLKIAVPPGRNLG